MMNISLVGLLIVSIIGLGDARQTTSNVNRLTNDEVDYLQVGTDVETVGLQPFKGFSPKFSFVNFLQEMCACKSTNY